MPQEVEAPSKEEFEAWKTSPVTEWFMAEISARCEEVQDRLAVGGALSHDSTAERVAMNYTRLVGITEGLTTALTLEPPVKEALS